ncbi:hypothetical protein E6C27_scaffold466G00180 [Cucumis melo var. makuwa]|uniref:Ty3-gypsy retrotransposon protein n=1 Tax=Cucumis melo var. makuwa TaxID=1194695 RepID=A0A5A7TUC7_CUCMM|nr:hypothetical protein E6C27_scaffold466G00180 [Cucumis melo var. makuwa]
MVVPFPSPSSKSHRSSFRPPRPSISELPLDLTHRAPPCVLHSTVSADALSLSAAWKRSRSSDSTKPRSVSVVERRRPMFVVAPPYFPPSTSGHGESSVRIVFDEFLNVATSDSSLNIGIRYGPTFHPLKVDPLSVDSIEGHNRVSGKGFPTTGHRIEAGNVVIHRGLHVTRPLVVACVLSGIRILCRWTLKFTIRYVVVIGLDIDHGVWSGKDDGLVWTEGTRLICASLGIARLIGVSFGITRLICAFYGTTRLLCRVRAQLGADRREAGSMREGHMDASDFLIASADVFC